MIYRVNAFSSILLCMVPVAMTFATCCSARAEDYVVSSPPAELQLPDFYKKYVNANGYPVVGSEKVNDLRVERGCLYRRHDAGEASGHSPGHDRQRLASDRDGPLRVHHRHS